MKLDKRKTHATWTKKNAKLWINTFPVSGNGVYAVLTCKVLVLCCLTETICVWTDLLILESAFLCKCYFCHVLIGQNWCQARHLAGTTAGWLHQKQVQNYRSTNTSWSFKTKLCICNISLPATLRNKTGGVLEQGYSSIPKMAEGHDSSATYATACTQKSPVHHKHSILCIWCHNRNL